MSGESPRTAPAQRALARVSLAAGAVLALTNVAAACPSCGLGQGMETLIYVFGFLGIPYLVVSVVILSMRKLVALEQSAGGD